MRSCWWQGLFLLLLYTKDGQAHSWVEQLTVIAPNGTFVGLPGYARGNFPRTEHGFSDTKMTHLIPPDGRGDVNLILPTDRMCMDSQLEQAQTDGSPRLRAKAGDPIALRYQENGHVTLPWNQPGKPPNRGSVYVYGTTQPRKDEKFLDVHGSWTADGTGGDRRGVLLSKQNFDDGRCYQINNGNISQTRQGKYVHQANSLMGADMWCQQDIQLPSTAPSGKLYTLYWVWDWPTLPGIDPTYPHGKAEIYTTCMDVEVANTPSRVLANTPEGYIAGQDLNDAAIPSQFANLDDVPISSETATPPPSSTLSSSPQSHSEPSASTSSTILSSMPQQPQSTSTLVADTAASPTETTPIDSISTVSSSIPQEPQSTSTLYLTSTETVRVLTLTQWMTVEKTVTVGESTATPISRHRLARKNWRK
ncbi:hypothetical protein POX_b02619 [Penicillium oxalicum]|uniref:DUF7492 domain-containing protein n=1 Tax=Penicillium oxalicum (strain 114-2 / CGMCC 5302) TaxID=933388 RepID=S8B6S8_PENO1|nr:hypothetical protein POX_b02619 [Penicillium oxalicum]EPS30372.1 hypothetical protein PDE_05323 [Penicillium oxalicum 114-2]KAI2792581.1 hypothetical protein POX_b02619 [Penicillium oxalicum]